MDEILKRTDKLVPSNKIVEDFLELSHQILLLAAEDIPRIEFLKKASHLIGNFSECETLEFCIEQFDIQYHWKAQLKPEKSFAYNVMPRVRCEIGEKLIEVTTDPSHPNFCISLLRKQFDKSVPFITENGSFYSGNIENTQSFHEAFEKSTNLRFNISKDCKSILIIPFEISNNDWGIMQLKSDQSFHFTESEIQFYEGIAQTLGLTVAYRRMKIECRERVKELTCLYDISHLSSQRDKKLPELLQSFVKLLPPAMQFPNLALARIVLDSETYQTQDFIESRYTKKLPLIVNNEERGFLEVAYREDKSVFITNPFLKEEDRLLSTIAHEIALVIDDRESMEYEAKLEEQLRHADRLATIGQLAAGVAHELNEPLGGILGFAQLIMKDEALSEQTREDVEKIIKASMHAREIVKKLMLFSRQIRTDMSEVDINKIVENGLYFLESRIKKEGIELVTKLDPDLPVIKGDQSQIHQVLVNLVVNAIQSMDAGGKLFIHTKTDKNSVIITVEDTGTGMSHETLNKIFLPFYTTKDIGEGTGIGLSVVHGIVTSHKGTIDVKSKIGKGSKFIVRFPIIERKENDDDW